MGKYIIVKNDRLYNGVIFDVRSYYIEDSMVCDKTIRCIVEKKALYMDIPPEDLSDGVWGTTRFYSKQREGRPYVLVSFVWKPTGKLKTYKPNKVRVRYKREEVPNVLNAMFSMPKKYREQLKKIFHQV